jgi:hypothetical protein
MEPDIVTPEPHAADSAEQSADAAEQPVEQLLAEFENPDFNIWNATSVCGFLGTLAQTKGGTDDFDRAVAILEELITWREMKPSFYIPPTGSDPLPTAEYLKVWLAYVKTHSIEEDGPAPPFFEELERQFQPKPTPPPGNIVQNVLFLVYLIWILYVIMTR